MRLRFHRGLVRIIVFDLELKHWWTEAPYFPQTAIEMQFYNMYINEYTDFLLNYQWASTTFWILVFTPIPTPLPKRCVGGDRWRSKAYSIDNEKYKASERTYVQV